MNIGDEVWVFECFYLEDNRIIDINNLLLLNFIIAGIQEFPSKEIELKLRSIDNGTEILLCPNEDNCFKSREDAIKCIISLMSKCLDC